MFVRFTNKLMLVVIFLVSEATLLFFHLRNDPEPYHSGFIYSQSLASSEGLMPTRDFLSPYGITGSILNGLYFNFAPRSLLSLLIFYGFLTIATGFFLYKSLLGRLGFATAFAINVTWVLTFVTTIPWPSLISTLLTLLAFSLLLECNLESRTFQNREKIRVIISIILLDLAMLTRIHLALVPILITAIMLFKASQEIRRYWLTTLFVVTGLLIVILQVTGILFPFIDQVIIWPLTGFSSPPMSVGLYFSFVWFPLITYFVFRIYRLINHVLSKNHSLMRRITLAMILVVPGVGIILLARLDFSRAPSTLRSGLGFLSVLRSNSQVTLGFLSATLIPLWVILLIRIVIKNRSLKNAVNKVSLNKWLALALGFSSLTQLFPLHDNVHIWFVTPLLILASVELFDIKNLTRNAKFAVLLLSFILLFNQGSFFLVSQEVDRIQLRSSELGGMYGTPLFAETVDKTMTELDKRIDTRSLRNECASGLYSVASRRFVSLDRNFIGNFFEIFTDSMPAVDPQKIEPQFVFQCNSNLESENRELERGYHRVFSISTDTIDSEGRVLYNVLYAR
jgi:hypothetical protein